MVQKFEVGKKTVETLLSDIRSGQILMPEIQRPFVWDTTKVRDLIDSIYRGFPVGYIITSKNPDVMTKDGVKALGKTLLIDGQQRLTALRASVLGETVINKRYKKVNIRIAFHPLEERFETLTPAIDKNSIWISDISKILSNDFSSYNFVNEYVQQNPDISPDQISKVVEGLRRRILTQDIGYIELSHELDVDTVAEIFERINSKGVPLNQADFAMSKLASYSEYGSNLRKLIDYFAHLSVEPNYYEHIAENDKTFGATDYLGNIKWLASDKTDLYDPDYNDILHVAFTHGFHRGKLADLVALLSGRNFDKRTYEQDIIDDSFAKLERSLIDFVNENNFKDFIQIIESTGFIDNKLISSKSALNFAYVLYLTMRQGSHNIGTIQKTVSRWFVMSILTGRYSSSPETVMDADIKAIERRGAVEMLNDIENAELSDTFWSIGLIQDFDKASIQHPYINTFFAAQIFFGDRGFLSSSTTLRSIKSIKGDIHHIFPYNYLKKHGLKERFEYNQIANFAYMEKPVNIQVSDKAPNEYMTLVQSQIDGSDLKIGRIDNANILTENLAENCIPAGFGNMTYENYDDFLKQRRVLMAQKIQKYYQSL